MNRFLYGTSGDSVGHYGLQELSVSKWHPVWGLVQVRKKKSSKQKKKIIIIKIK